MGRVINISEEIENEINCVVIGLIEKSDTIMKILTYPCVLAFSLEIYLKKRQT